MPFICPPPRRPPAPQSAPVLNWSRSLSPRSPTSAKSAPALRSLVSLPARTPPNRAFPCGPLCESGRLQRPEPAAAPCSTPLVSVSARSLPPPGATASGVATAAAEKTARQAQLATKAAEA
ncbi:hypothetical protein TGFOU_305080, partial [Toxoplasma gondii FOU]